MQDVSTAIYEKNKYQKVWRNRNYRMTSPSEAEVETFLMYLKPKDTVVELGCGTGRASREIHKKGFDVQLFDIADNCLDKGISLPLTVGCLWIDDIPRADWGFCCDVMEHIPTDYVNKALYNIKKSLPNVYFRIHLCEDNGKFTDEPLHLTVGPVDWWVKKLKVLWPNVFCDTNDIYSIFICRS